MRRAVSSLLFVATLAGASPLLAQTAAELEAARGLYQQGSELEKAKDYAGAYEKFRKVAEIKSTAIVRYHEGYCAEKLGKWVEALDAYARGQLDGQGDPKQKDAVEASHKAAEALRARIPKIKVKINGGDGKSQVSIDDHPVSAVLLDEGIPVNVGTHTVAISGGSAADDKQEVTVAEKDVKEVVFEAKAKAGGGTPPPEDKGKGKGKDENVPPPPPPEGKGKDAKSAGATTYVAPSFGLVFGLSLGSISPGGQIQDPTATAPFAIPDPGGGSPSTNASDFMATGAAVEADVGVRFLPALAAYGFWQHGFLQPGDAAKQASTSYSVSTDAFGLGLMLNTNPGGRWGFYGDLAASFRVTKVHRGLDDGAGNVSNEEYTLTGAEPLRLKLGVAYKPAAKFTIVGFVWASAGSYTKMDVPAAGGNGNETITVDKTAVHTFAGLGLGGFYDLTFGK